METPKFHLNGGHIVIIAIFIVGQGLSFWGLAIRYENRLTGIENTARSAAESVEKLSATVHFMDENGTHRSQQGISTDLALGNSNARRLDTQETAMTQLIPKVERMNTNIEWMMMKLRDPDKIK